MHNFWTNRVGGPELDQQAIEILPPQTNSFLNRICKVTTWVDGDLLKVFRLRSLERHRDPLDIRPSEPKRQVFELCGLGEIKRRRPRRVYIHE